MQYDLLDSQTFSDLLDKVCSEAGLNEIMSVPGVTEILSEHYNNDVLERWEDDLSLEQAWSIFRSIEKDVNVDSNGDKIMTETFLHFDVGAEVEDVVLWLEQNYGDEPAEEKAI